MMEKLPEACPQCEKKFSSIVRPKSKMQKKASTLFLIGIAVTFPWALLVLFVVSASPVIVVPASPGAAGVFVMVGGVIVTAPGLLLGSLAMKMARVLKMNCRQCGWSQIFFLHKGVITAK